MAIIVLPQLRKRNLPHNFVSMVMWVKFRWQLETRRWGENGRRWDGWLHSSHVTPGWLWQVRHQQDFYSAPPQDSSAMKDHSRWYLLLLFKTLFFLNVEVLGRHLDNLGWFRERLLKDGVETHHEWRKETRRVFTREHPSKYSHALLSLSSSYLFSSPTLFSQTQKMSCPHRVVSP